MKSTDLQYMLCVLTKKSKKNREAIKNLQETLETENLLKNETFGYLDTRPSYMNFVQGNSAMEDTNTNATKILDHLHAIQQILKDEIASYKKKLKEIVEEPDVEDWK
ncbi:hypothetical protein L1887_35357 [Cichorium endivia]|nr:hypothetical protein L1887_35357 [Cichorium endivia]